MIESPRGPPDLLRATCSTTAVLVTLLTVVSVKVVFVMDSVTTAGLFTVTADGRVTLTLSLDLNIENLAKKRENICLVTYLIPSGIMESNDWLFKFCELDAEVVGNVLLLLAEVILVPVDKLVFLFSPGIPPSPGSL